MYLFCKNIQYGLSAAAALFFTTVLVPRSVSSTGDSSPFFAYAKAPQGGVLASGMV